MHIYTKHLSEPWFSLIRIGVKTCEGRLNTGDFAEMEDGVGVYHKYYKNNEDKYKIKAFHITVLTII